MRDDAMPGNLLWKFRASLPSGIASRSCLAGSAGSLSSLSERHSSRALPAVRAMRAARVTRVVEAAVDTIGDGAIGRWNGCMGCN
ncbi:hypothetical protein [Burkholderia plantarii]|uniref:hypothetical protein n=1 Tax=Burkholderia plantarii TaxID=41899 RepID=UPI000A54B030|nr:hypothetical protein [Burkholderia plantarii]GLZ21295.1 hypothetical protein Bpla01_48240 [Burkholderia plantarii]